jgi:hypothetical protein
MKPNKYEILRKHINSISLVSLTSQNWYDEKRNLKPWTIDNNYFGPKVGDVVYNTNISGNLVEGYYKWNGTNWVKINEDEAFLTYTLPIYLESSVDEMGVMVGFDGEIQQVEELVNFSYSGVTNTKTVNVYSTTNPEKLRKIVDQIYTIDWGDNTATETLEINKGIPNSILPTLTHTYGSTVTSSIITITLNSPWTTQIVSKRITLPFNNPQIISNPLGTFSGATMPIEIDYINQLDDSGNLTGPTTFKFMGIGKSRIDELRKYGQTEFDGITTGTTDGSNWTGYTIDNLYYQDFIDGYTMITGSTESFTKEEVINRMITRDEHFLGFIDEPIIYSDIFVERGKQGVMEKNLRLSEIDNIGEMEVYGNGYFNVRKQ